MDDSTKFKQAIRLYEAGEPDQAGVLLAEWVRAHPNDAEGWSWLARCVRTDRQREWCQEQLDRISQQQSFQNSQPAPQATYWIPVDEYQNTPAQTPWWRKYRWSVVLLILGAVTVALVLLIWLGLPALSLRAADDVPAAVDFSIGGEPTLTEMIGDPQQFFTGQLSSPHTAFLPGVLISPPTPTAAVAQLHVDTSLPAAIPDQRPNPKKWKSWPVLPFVSEYARQVWRAGVNEGNDPHAFSVLGDCHSQPDVLFGRFSDSALWDSPEYKAYKKTLKYYRNSWDHSNITVANGMSVASALNPTWARSSACKSNETPLACELRVHNPSLLIISLGTNWGSRNPQEFEDYLRQIVDLTLKEKVLPIIVTKGDPAGPHNPLNERMIAVAYDYDLPLWNFWIAIQELPYQGLKPWDRNGVYLSPEAWSIKRDTGLQALDQVRQVVTGNE